jgi:hypothetical protein
MEEDHEV